MNITVEKDDLLQGIQVVQGAASTKGALPILSNILIETQNNGVVRLTATDLDLAVSSDIPAQITEAGSITIPAKKFLDIIKELRSQEKIKIQVKKNQQINVESGKTYFRLTGLQKEDFPQIPDFRSSNPLSIPQTTLKQMIRLTSFAVSRDEARYVLNGILFSFKERTLRLVATDGRRLAMVEKDLGKPLGWQKNIIVPNKAIQELNRNLREDGEVILSLKENQLQFTIGTTVMTTRLIEGEFPNYEQVIPKKNKEELWLNTQEFLSAARRASVFTNQESQSIKLDFSKNRLVLSKSAPDVGEVREEIETEYVGGDLSIGFNPSYLIDALKNIDDEKVQFGLIDPEKPGMIKAKEDFTYIILPMQLT